MKSRFTMSRLSVLTQSQHVTRMVLGVGMLLSGAGHLTFARKAFQAQVPRWIPMDKDAVVLGSGVVEVLFGISFAALPRHRRVIGVALAAFYTAIFPGNIGQYAERQDAFGLDTDIKRAVRLFFQPALIAAALWGAGLPERAGAGRS